MAMKSSGTLFSAPLFAAILCVGFPCGIASAQQVTISRDSPLHADPKADAPAVGQLKQGSSAEVIGKQGAWVNVKSAAGTGWTYSFNVSYAAGGAGPAVATPTRKGVQSTIGIRGLEEEDLKAAKFDGKQLDALDAFATGAEGAEPAKGSAPKGRKK